MEKHKPNSCLAILRYELPENRIQIINRPFKRAVINGATTCIKSKTKYFRFGSNAGFILNQDLLNSTYTYNTKRLCHKVNHAINFFTNQYS